VTGRDKLWPGLGGRQGQKSGQGEVAGRDKSLARARRREGNRVWPGLGGGKGTESGQG
jgi:hypothetical protein